MFPIHLFTYVHHADGKTISSFSTAFIIIINVVVFLSILALSLALRSKADKKETQVALDKKADKNVVDDLKAFMQLRFDDVKTLIVELSKKS